MSRYLLRLAVPLVLGSALCGLAPGSAPAPLSAQEAAAADPAPAEPPPSPAAVLGHAAGEDGWIASWAEIVTYFDTLDAASPLVTVERIGESVDGRPMVMAVITSASNQLDLDSLRARQARLADPRGLPHAAVEEIIATQPAVAFIGRGISGTVRSYPRGGRATRTPEASSRSTSASLRPSSPVSTLRLCSPRQAGGPATPAVASDP